ncbi:MAG TPA: PBP1A family penicillin-binding protein [Kofleriaceae bacterium]|nr:PBP1A family penicillin-binding protein [Kofleriaceae bacterium]
MIDKLLGRRKNKRRRTRKLSAERPPRTGRQKVWLAVKWCVLGGLLVAAIGTATVAGMFWYYGSDSDLPSINSLDEYAPPEVTRLTAADGTVVGEIFSERRTVVPFEDIPKTLVDAFVSAEDAAFFEHEGIDYFGMLRAFVVDIKAGEVKQGASTITQQVVKTFLLTPERTIKRKIQEIILSRRLESALTKEEILYLYLNQINFGHGRYGVAEAAHYYFGKKVGDLNVGEMAMLAGLPQAPTSISPKDPDNVHRAKARQSYVLRQMAENGYITPEVAQKWIDAPIKVVSDPFPHIGEAPEWVNVVRDALEEKYPDKDVYKLGAQVKTTMDLDIQRLATAALQKGLRGVDKRQGYGHPDGHVREDKIDLEISRLKKRLPKKGPKSGPTYRGVVVKVTDDPAAIVADIGGITAQVTLGTAADERYNPEDKKPSERFKRGDMVQIVLTGKADEAGTGPRKARFAEGPQGAVVVIDPHTRRVLAMVGGYSQNAGDFNRATMAKRQAGSTFKPFVYTAAIDSGDFTAASIINDAPEVYDLWKPQNFEKGEFRGPVRLRFALAKSINTVAIRVCHDIGPARVAEVARWMGIESKLPEQLSLALGSGEVTPLELTNAYATFAAGGKVAPPQLLAEINGEAIPGPEMIDAIRPEIAYVMVNVLRSVITNGTGGRAQRLKIPTLVGKTGTSNDARDAWFMGMTPNIVIGVWVGFDDNHPLGRGEEGSHTALPVFMELVKNLDSRWTSGEYVRPPGVIEVEIDKATGLLAAEGSTADQVYTETFIAGTEPTEHAPSPGEVTAPSFILNQYDNGEGDSAGFDLLDEAYGDANTGEGESGDPAGTALPATP